ncbi:phosphoenolpyruvate--protein phosphotransferase [Marispirochaeta aestuarii]|uniref:phosphoenolpyruvate--protein phosphotransferase n=1 Tax=Marispirochaeta aestuarii TaxID=1963862 RepID=UPI0029C916DC|nr:phosphoenolpyruvate--protein phosphotransferase [Marispirochaeta aestuarii]
MRELTGISASPGITIGTAFLYIDDAFTVPHYDVDESDLEREYERFEEALEKATQEIIELKDQTSSSVGGNENNFLDAHILMIQDPDFADQIKQNLKGKKKNVEWILQQTIEGVINKLSSSQDSYISERSIDLHDVSKRVLNHLMYRERISLADLSAEVILVTHNLLPSDALAMNTRKVKGIAMDAGGKTSHTAILARAFEIPAVLGLSAVTSIARTGDTIIIDGNRGKVIVDPNEATLKTYEEILQKWQQREVQLATLNQLPAETQDGKHILLGANIEVPEETDAVIAHGADGIGLFRSEFLFMQPGGVSDEEQQYEAYTRVVKSVEGKPVTIRTLDVGGDKAIPGFEQHSEKNPILGWRAVRFCFSRTDLFKIQLRAILRASVHGDLRIMFPMISGVEEVDRALELLEEARSECREKGQPFNEDISVGIMIEVPSAALTSDILARKVDFFSIGTNDLIQYTIAVDRGNERVAYLYEPFHPGVLRLIKMVIDNAHSAGIPVNMCGEMAGDPIATVILLGMGLDVFSMSSFSIPEVKQIIRSTSMMEAEELVGEIMEMKSYREIDEHVRGWMNARYNLEGYTG